MKTELATPGPWVHNLKILCDGYNDDGEKINQRTIKDYYSVVAGEGFWNRHDNSTGFELTGYISEANARLLAAAPELLEELEGAYNFLSVFKKQLPNGDWLDAINAGLKSMQLAINKAKDQ